MAFHFKSATCIAVGTFQSNQSETSAESAAGGDWGVEKIVVYSRERIDLDRVDAQLKAFAAAGGHDLDAVLDRAGAHFLANEIGDRCGPLTEAEAEWIAAGDD